MWIDDQVLEKCASRVVSAVWVPQTPMVVLGSSNDAARECNVAACSAAQIPVLRRYGGGGAVVLYQGCVVLSLGMWVREQFQNSKYFRLVNAAVVNAVARRWPVLGTCTTRGISDIAWGEKKVAGTSMFRSRNWLLYQASILVELDLPLIATCLAHPSKEPDYRKGRSHGDFLTALAAIDAGITPEALREALEAEIHAAVEETMGEELVDPDEKQIQHLLARARSAPASENELAD
jgi:lipoate-protein ligase A